MKLELRLFTNLNWFSFLGLLLVLSLYFLGLELIAERYGHLCGEWSTLRKHAGVGHQQQDFRLGGIKARSLVVVVPLPLQGLVVLGTVVAVLIRLQLHVQRTEKENQVP